VDPEPTQALYLATLKVMKKGLILVFEALCRSTCLKLSLDLPFHGKRVLISLAFHSSSITSLSATSLNLISLSSLVSIGEVFSGSSFARRY